MNRPGTCENADLVRDRGSRITGGLQVQEKDGRNASGTT